MLKPLPDPGLPWINSETGRPMPPFAEYMQSLNLAVGPVKTARVYNSADIACANNTIVTLTFDSERYDTDAMHTGSGSRLTATTAGKYDIKGTVSYEAAAAGARLVRILLNGATIIANETRAPASAVDPTVMTVATVYDLAANDYVELQAYQNSGGPLNALHTANYSPEFMMTRLGA